MDKLKPLITHKFWIILFIALILPVVGWSMATGNLSKEIDERKTALDKAFTDAQVSPNPPNDTWSSALREINEKKQNYIGESHKFLWEKQKSMFVWPPNIAPLMKDIPYRGEISMVPRNLYRSAYEFEIRRIHKLANPFSLRDGTGTVNLTRNTIPHVPLDKWQTMPPTPEEMWDAQEDVWLTTSILKAIAEVNKNAPNITESPIRRISVLELRGGTVGDDGSVPDMGAGGMEGDMMMEGPGAGGGMFGGGGRNAMPGMGDGKNGTLSIAVDMDLMKVFGNNVDASASPEGGGMDDMPEGGAMIPGGFGGGPMGMGSENLIRYYHKEEDLPYKTRGFYLKATIQSSKLPDLLAALTNMPWPTKIVRVQRADMYDDHMNPIASTNSVGGSSMGGSRGGGMGTGNDFDDSEFGGSGGSMGRPGAGAGFRGEVDIDGNGMQAGTDNRSLLEAALNDPELAVVTIAGLMTIYKPYTPPEGAEVVAETDGTQQPADPSMATPTEQQPGTPATQTPAGTPATPGSTPPVAGVDTPESPAPPANTPADSPEPKPDEPEANSNTTPATPTEEVKPDTTQPPQNKPQSEPAENQ